MSQGQPASQPDSVDLPGVDALVHSRLIDLIAITDDDRDLWRANPHQLRRGLRTAAKNLRAIFEVGLQLRDPDLPLEMVGWVALLDEYLQAYFEEMVEEVLGDWEAARRLPTARSQAVRRAATELQGTRPDLANPVLARLTAAPGAESRPLEPVLGESVPALARIIYGELRVTWAERVSQKSAR